MGSLTNLSLLYASNNQLTTLSPEVGKLTKLNLQNNKLTELSIDIADLTRLTELDITGNKLPVEEIERLKIAMSCCRLLQSLGSRRGVPPSFLSYVKRSPDACAGWPHY